MSVRMKLQEIRLDKFIEQINFNEDIYPFFGVVRSYDRDGFELTYTPFSPFNANTQKNITLSKRSEIYFFQKNRSIHILKMLNHFIRYLRLMS